MIHHRFVPSLSQIGRLAIVMGLGLAGAGIAKAGEATYAQRMACTPDAWRLCSSEIPDISAVRACMIANKANLSDACRATFRNNTASR